MPCNPRHTPNTGTPSFAAWRTSSGTPKSLGRPGPGENQNQRGLQALDQIEREAGAIRHHFGAGLARVIRQRVDEAILVIDQQQRTPPPSSVDRHVARLARRRRVERAEESGGFEPHSRSSLAGTES